MLVLPMVSTGKIPSPTQMCQNAGTRVGKNVHAVGIYWSLAAQLPPEGRCEWVSLQWLTPPWYAAHHQGQMCNAAGFNGAAGFVLRGIFVW